MPVAGCRPALLGRTLPFGLHLCPFPIEFSSWSALREVMFAERNLSAVRLFFFFFFFLDFCATCNRYTFIMPTLIKKYSLRRLSLLSQLKYSAVMYCNVAYVSFSCRRLEHCDGEAMSFAGGILFSLQ